MGGGGEGCGQFDNRSVAVRFRKRIDCEHSVSIKTERKGKHARW